MELLLIRHGLPVRMVQADGPVDPPLSERGQEQARRLADYLGGEAIGSVWSSPMLRARETAAPLAEALGAEVLVDHELAEYDKNASAYIPLEQLKAEAKGDWFALVEGELSDPAGFRAGVVTAIEHIITGSPGGTAAVICHAGVINAYIGHILGVDRSLWFEPKYTSIHRILASRRGDRSIHTLNETAHLRGTNLLV